MGEVVSTDIDLDYVDAAAASQGTLASGEWEVTREEFKAARLTLGLSQSQLADMLGYHGKNKRKIIDDLETGVKDIFEPQARMVRAFLEGYRPPDWPTP